MSLALGLERPLVVRTVPVDDPGELIAVLPHTAPYAWVRHGAGLVGWGEAAAVTVPHGPDRFAWARAWLNSIFQGAEIHDEVGLPGSGPVAFGSFTFDPDSPGSTLVVPATVLARRDGRAWLTTIGEDTLDLVTPARAPGPIRYQDGTLTAREWEHAVATAVKEINSGRLDKVVLARDVIATAPGRIDPRALLARLSARYPDCYTFSVRSSGSGSSSGSGKLLVGATPELLVRHTGQAIESLVLAGTAPTGSDPADLLSSEKNQYEHVCAVASVRDALAPLCADLDVPDRPELLVLPNVQHLASRITGRLSDGASVLDVVAAMHPTAAVGGTPTATALDVIRELEDMDRGGYAGPVGWIDARGDGEWGIALRCAYLSGDAGATQARLFAGCGIMAESDPAQELLEAQAKLRVMRYALEG